MKVNFENDFQKKVMVVSFDEPTTISDASGIQALRTEWLKGLASWHSPYKALLDCRHLTVTTGQEHADEWQRFLSFLKGFYMKSLLAFNASAVTEKAIPVECVDEAEARQRSGLNRVRQVVATDFRSAVIVENHFQQHVMEVSFENDVTISSQLEIDALKSKITNNLMQWHSPWNLLVDCHRLVVAAEAQEPLAKMLAYFKSFFLKDLVGYSPNSPQATYPFKVFRSRHRAAAMLESEGMIRGNDATCRSKPKSDPSGQ